MKILALFCQDPDDDCKDMEIILSRCDHVPDGMACCPSVLAFYPNVVIFCQEVVGFCSM